ncbi:MAG: glycosyltransferase [Verrucomicrobiales bacterium]|nr:glycosyltransferase [Verrucomicrobiales bacterium]
MEQGINNYPIIVHCHLRWEGVWQRPQQFLSRLSKNHRILFVEGPLLHDRNEVPTYSIAPVPQFPNITVMQTHFPASRFNDGPWVDKERLRLLKEAINGPLEGEFENPVQWIYDPMATTAFAGEMNESALVYDCMDELSQFKFAPPELISRERELLSKADVVFTGGRKLWQSKSRYNKNVHFYGCGVDVPHFSKARDEATELPEDIKSAGKPVLGYFGVVDERLDYELIAKLVDGHPDWTVVMVGPVVKVDPNSLPRHERILWLGRREYAQLPSYTKGFDVCMMPFAMNEATEFINPTKALEYMATARPIVSSPVPDVVSNFADAVKIAHSHDEFIALCIKAVEEPDEDAIERGIQMAEENQWHMIVAKLEGHIQDALNEKKKSGAASSRGKSRLSRDLATA